MLGGVDAAKGKTTRRRRSSKKKTETEVPEKVAKTAAVKNKKSIEPVVKEAETPDEAKESDTESEK
jgi:hypothetical protein